MKRFIFFIFLIQPLLFIAQTTDATGKKQGYWKKYDERTNRLVYEGEFKDNRPMGRFKYYHPNDSVRAILDFKKEGAVSYATLFYPNGKRMARGKYAGREVKDSVWTFYDELGTLISRDVYSMGKKNGTCYVYLPDGKISEEKNYKMDKENGPFKQYFDGTHLRGQGVYVDGKLEGRVAYYYPNGIEVAAGYYKNGVQSGPWIYKKENGDVKERELYVNGNLASAKETAAFFAKYKAPAEKPKPGTKTSGTKKPDAAKAK